MTGDAVFQPTKKTHSPVTREDYQFIEHIWTCLKLEGNFPEVRVLKSLVFQPRFQTEHKSRNHEIELHLLLKPAA
ncbi:uncharacterized protein RSE6_08313 [Rhynchosporium secalis]|uniref:Uncharacterized protein n=1 Tax=Rhynchosporium secalis TaxID=38038 RepID=A0A1E1MF35_RHYSE|nr:uncharacterized protein RSE6_08313 [Rhynchosporium secalis]